MAGEIEQHSSGSITSSSVSCCGVPSGRCHKQVVRFLAYKTAVGPWCWLAWANLVESDIRSQDFTSRFRWGLFFSHSQPSVHHVSRRPFDYSWPSSLSGTASRALGI